MAYGQQTPQSWWDSADSSQKASIRASYDNNKAYDKGFTLAAFSPIESSGCVNLLRLGENSGGCYAQRAFRVAQRVYKVETPTEWQVSRVLQKLITDREFDDEQARAHLDELLNQYGGDWMKIWQGWNGQRPGQAEEVQAWVKFLQTQFK